VRTDDEQHLLGERPHQAHRLMAAEHVAQPLQRVLRTVGEIGPADEAFEQTDLGGEDILLSADGSFDRHAHARDAGVRRPVAALRRLTLASADDQRGGRGQQSGAEPGVRRFQQ